VKFKPTQRLEARLINALLNKKVLSLILKISKLEIDLIVVGSRFQSLGAAQLNDLFTQVFCRGNFCRTKIASSFKHVRNPCDIAATDRTKNRTWFTRAILKLQP